MNWESLEREAPQLAGATRARFGQAGLALLGTIRKGGSPRITPVEPFFACGHLLLGMLWRSPKALDLLREPRCVLHSVVTDLSGAQGEFQLRGRAVEVRDPARQQQYRLAFADRWGANTPQRFHIFALDIEQAVWVVWQDDGRTQIVKRWDPGRGYQEIRR